MTSLRERPDFRAQRRFADAVIYIGGSLLIGAFVFLVCWGIGILVLVD